MWQKFVKDCAIITKSLNDLVRYMVEMNRKQDKRHNGATFGYCWDEKYEQTFKNLIMLHATSHVLMLAFANSRKSFGCIMMPA